MSTPTSPNLMSLPEELLFKIFGAAVPLDCPAASKANAYSVWELNTLVSHSYYRIAEEAFIENFITRMKLRYPASWALNINGISAVKNTWPKEIQYPIRRLHININAPDRQGIQTAITDIENGLDMYRDLREVTVMLETEKVAKSIKTLEDELWTNLLKRRKDMICRRGWTPWVTMMLTMMIVCGIVFLGIYAAQIGAVWAFVLMLSVLLYLNIELFLGLQALRQQGAPGAPQQPALHTGPVIRAISGFLVNAILTFNHLMNW
ncbi:hypothetical protein LTS10_001056 [Elasticomyces elasticus]|nr:hypothetical protein LTS10_001056 [Elasticomyces elasticus]